MVVLEAASAPMITIGNTQYLQPDYASPLSSSLDSKSSPLALLAQTCSQIGADSSSIKSGGEKRKSKSDASSKSPLNLPKTPKSSSSPSTDTRSLSFKPYEMNVLSRSDDRPSSKSSSVNGSVCDEKSNKMRTATPLEVSAVNNSEMKSESREKSNSVDVDRKSSSPRESSSSSQRDASPIIRSGLEVMHGVHSKPGAYGMSPMNGLGFLSGMEQHTSPAFRSPLANGFQQHHSALLAAAAAAGYANQSAAAAAVNQCVSYARIKTPTGGETIVPVCKDPYCTGCQYSQHNQYAMMGVPCPNGCTQCEQQKYGLAMSMSGLPPNHPYAQLGRPYVCSWTNGESYCGKRCATSDELLQHLRTHTTNLSDPAATAVLLQSQQQAMMHPALNPLFAMSPMHRSYPTPPLSPLSAARYLPYTKPGQSMPTSPYATFNQSALNHYYSPYALYGQRIGTTVAHQ